MTPGAQTTGNIAVYGSAMQLAFVLIHGLTDKSDTVVEFDSDRCVFYCDFLTSGNSACLSTAAAMLS